MRADDLAQLKRYKEKKQKVNRKASKGRKIKYTVHNKIQNFMFPIPLAAMQDHSIDAERLFHSLFQ
jgi:protein AATF/BFR2